MQLDKTRILIRERAVLEIMDLALHVIREFFMPLSCALLLGVIPMALLNFLLIGWMAQWNYLYDGSMAFPLRYAWDMSLLVFIEAPLATVFVTTYLGQAVFVERPSLRHVIKDVYRMTPRLIWCQLLLRGVLVAWLLMWGAANENDTYICEFFLFCLAFSVGLLRAMRPFMNEIVLLERNPLRARDPQTMTVGKRSNLLHGMIAGDLFLQWLTASFISAVLAVAFGNSLYVAVASLTNDWTWNSSISLLIIPATLWLVTGFVAVVRFLNYLDSRIRQEGWEIELRLRAEATRLASKLS